MTVISSCFYTVFVVSVVFGSLARGTTYASDDVTCDSPSSASYHLNIFEDLISNHTSLADSLSIAPLISGMSDDAAAFAFAGRGFHLIDSHISNSIRTASCLTNEVTISAGIFFSDSDTDGMLLELSYSDRIEAGIPVYAVQMDAAADEIRVAYRHRGALHVEVLSTRLHGGRWRTYALELSGNQLSLYIDCRLITRRRIPLPDYCVNDADVIVTVADTTYEDQLEYTGQNGLHAYVQNLSLNFGSGGVNRLCTSLSTECPSCGQFLRMVEKSYKLQQHVAELKERITVLESTGGKCNSTVTPTVDPNVQKNDCIYTDTLLDEVRILSDDTFVSLADGRICYCADGNLRCTTLFDCTPNFTPPPPSMTTRPPDDTQAPLATVPPEGSCESDNLPGRVVKLGEYEGLHASGQCTVYTCRKVGILILFSEVGRFNCSDEVYNNCSNLTDPVDIEVSMCCGKCSECSFITCQDNSECVQLDDSATCRCKKGYQLTLDDRCIDIDECRLGRQDRGHNCPVNSTCLNTNGSFDCICRDGFFMAETSNGIRRCEDRNECADPATDPCLSVNNSHCINEIGSYNCVCREQYQKIGNQCQPICESPCLNGGRCLSPNVCTCLPGYTGDFCQDDIDECSSPSTHNCGPDTMECVNTQGGFFCRCRAGYARNGTECQDINECGTRIHNCLEDATCMNSVGSYRCICSNATRPAYDCTGSCRRRNTIIPNGQWRVDNCINCTCLNGERVCRKVECNCSNLTGVPDGCCNQCNNIHRRCTVTVPSGEIFHVRPSFTFYAPEDRCQRYDCHRDLRYSHTNLSADCPKLDCLPSMQTLPMGKCCPVCMLPKCNSNQEGRVVSFRNGCEKHMCSSGHWSQQSTVSCPEITCSPENILFYKDGCCPVCAGTVLSALPNSCLANKV